LTTQAHFNQALGDALRGIINAHANFLNLVFRSPLEPASQPKTIDRQRTTLTNRKARDKESTPYNTKPDALQPTELSNGDAFQVDREHSGERLEPDAFVAAVPSAGDADHGADLLVRRGHPGPAEVGLEVLEPDLAIPVPVHEPEGVLHGGAAPGASRGGGGAAGQQALELVVLHETVAVGVGGRDHGREVVVVEPLAGRGPLRGGVEGLEVLPADAAVPVRVKHVERRPQVAASAGDGGGGEVEPQVLAGGAHARLLRRDSGDDGRRRKRRGQGGNSQTVWTSESERDVRSAFFAEGRC